MIKTVEKKNQTSLISNKLVEQTKPGYKKTKLGWIPEEWNIYKFKQISFIDKESISNGISSDYSFTYLSLSDVEKGEIINSLLKIKFHDAPSRARRKVKNGDILLSTVRPNLLGYYYFKLPVKDFIVSTGFSVITPKDNVSGEYIYQSLYGKALQNQFYRLIVGSNYPAINSSDVKNLRIPLPPLPEQRKIAQILSTWDKAIEKTEQLIQTKTQLKKGLMQQLLTGKKRFKEFIFTNKRHNSKVGLIPKDWKIKKLHEIAKFSNGKAHEKYIVENGNYFVVNSKFISTEGKVVKRSNECLSPLNTGDIAIVMSDIPQGVALAKCYFITVDNKYTLNQRIGCIRPYNADNQFVYFILNRNKFYLKFDDGVSQTNLRKYEVIECPIPLPSLQEQRKITSTLNLIQNEINLLQNNLKLLITQKKGLMQKLLTGEVRVKID
ncbi:MAG: restriction endonuclease subunit S [Bacteroidales bacterium]|jgi:type I restriction enzyme S subunit|nr:restriction endonuclease subunit S [Bacteroidales bacterium]MCK4638685.1 restriction endonuclease subunit S [Bacteroidales bacterium]